jgi:hypothetical protein
MARSDFDPYQIIDDWRRLCNQSPFIFNQALGIGSNLFDHNTNTSTVFVQPDRDLAAQSMTEAFERLRDDVLNFAAKPSWVVEEEINFDRTRPLALQRLSTRYGFLQAIGRRATTLIEADVAITYSDVGGLGTNDTATMTTTTTVDADEIAIFYRVTDGAPSAANQYWRIYPAKVTKSGNTATIVADRANFIKKVYIDQPYESPNFNEGNAADTGAAGDYLTAVDVYRVYADPATAVQLKADPYFEGDYTSTTLSNTNASAIILNKRLGEFAIRTGADLCPTPYKVVVSYYAGYDLQNGLADYKLKNAVVRLANTLMRKVPNGLNDVAHNVYQSDNEDLGARNIVPPFAVNNPFGYKRGAIEAYRIAMQYRIGQGGLMTGIAG